MGNKQHCTPTQTTIRDDRNVRKVLLLGTGASGKSTLCRSITTHYHPYNIPDYDFKGQIISTLTEAILRTSLTQYKEWNFLASQNKQALKANEIDPETASAIKKLWSIEHVREQLRITQSLPNAIHDMKYLSYYISRLDELSKPHSTLTAEDYTRIRVKTTGIVELEVPLNKHHTLQLLDVGGNRNERRKWIHCFENVNCVIFCVPLPEYQQCIYEDMVTNRALETSKLFEEVARHTYLKNLPIFVLFTKPDALSDALLRVDFRSVFPDYEGRANSCIDVINYMKEKYMNMVEREGPVLPWMLDCADSGKVQEFFKVVEEFLFYGIQAPLNLYDPENNHPYAEYRDRIQSCMRYCDLDFIR